MIFPYEISKLQNNIIVMTIKESSCLWYPLHAASTVSEVLSSCANTESLVSITNILTPDQDIDTSPYVGVPS